MISCQLWTTSVHGNKIWNVQCGVRLKNVRFGSLFEISWSLNLPCSSEHYACNSVLFCAFCLCELTQLITTLCCPLKLLNSLAENVQQKELTWSYSEFSTRNIHQVYCSPSHNGIATELTTFSLKQSRTKTSFLFPSVLHRRLCEEPIASERVDNVDDRLEPLSFTHSKQFFIASGAVSSCANTQKKRKLT